jgi:hypothetical protein
LNKLNETGNSFSLEIRLCLCINWPRNLAVSFPARAPPVGNEPLAPATFFLRHQPVGVQFGPSDNRAYVMVQTVI